MKHEPSTIDEELGKAIADRLGLRHDDTLREWSVEGIGTRTVAVKMTTFKAISVDEFNELRSVAVKRVTP